MQGELGFVLLYRYGEGIARLEGCGGGRGAGQYL